MLVVSDTLHCLCGGRRFTTVFEYHAPPEGETRFSSGAGQSYHRRIVRCEGCGHFLSAHEMDLARLYAGDYVNCTYGEEGMRHAFERIVSLPASQSDNAGRVSRLVEFAAKYFTDGKMLPSVLDVGSGLCVFLHRMKAAGWRCTALDPDPRAVQQAKEVVGIESLCGDFMQASGLGRFDVVTFNKVLEHVPDPLTMLRKALEHVAPGGFVYCEVPDGEAAAADGPGREEFFLDHWHVFSAASLALLVSQAGYSLRALERLREPSGKYTLRAFLAPAR